MTTYSYLNQSISSPSILYNSLLNAGENNVQFIYKNGVDIDVITNVLTKSETDTAVADANDGTLFSNKYLKIGEVSNNSLKLIAEGIEAFSSGKNVPVDKVSADGYYTDYEFFVTHSAKISTSSPYIVESMEGSYVSTDNSADILKLSEDAADRLIYVYTSTLNSDGSKGEAQLIKDILAATDQSALDAITDTRV